jgi:glutaredoxin 2
LSDENVTNSGDNNSFQFLVFSPINKIFYKKVTKIGDILLNENFTKIGEKLFTKKRENFSESLKISIKTSPKLAKIQGNHQNW